MYSRNLVPYQKAVETLGAEYFREDRQYGWAGDGGFLMHDILDNRTTVHIYTALHEKCLAWYLDFLRTELQQEVPPLNRVCGSFVDAHAKKDLTALYSLKEHLVESIQSSDDLSIDHLAGLIASKFDTQHAETAQHSDYVQSLFILFGWLCMLYKAKYQPRRDELEVFPSLPETTVDNDDYKPGLLFVNLLSWTTGPGNDYMSILEERSREEQDAFAFLLTQMDGLALGIQLMAAIIKFRHLTDNLLRFENYRKTPHRMHQKDIGIEKHTLATLWKMSFQEVKSNRMPGQCWMCCVSRNETTVDDAIIDVLKTLSLVERHKNTLSLHCLTQAAFLFQQVMSMGERQEVFDSATLLIHAAFPRQEKGRAMHGVWQTCEKYKRRVWALAESYRSRKRARLGVSSTDELTELLDHCLWYMYERGTQREALQLIDIAVEACRDKNSLVYAHLLNFAGVIHFNFNELALSREALQKALTIRQAQLEPTHEEVAATLANLAGNQDRSLELWKRIMEIRQNIQAPKLNFARGNLELAQFRYDAARSHFQTALDIILESAKDDLKIAAIQYKIAMSLKDGLRIARLRQLDGGPGHESRILWKEAQVLEKHLPDPGSSLLELADARDPEHMRQEAEAIRRKISTTPGSGLYGDELDEERIYTVLFNPWYR
ncbi:hypothetical protein F4778DRAFT_784878 [Xylariomycetidae sp. FL2044]|nr:hypothetical protein F4778DRAFT_784878 [Xylariomycetidae sp. FL2044]